MGIDWKPRLQKKHYLVPITVDLPGYPAIGYLLDFPKIFLFMTGMFVGATITLLLDHYLGRWHRFDGQPDGEVTGSHHFR